RPQRNHRAAPPPQGLTPSIRRGPRARRVLISKPPPAVPVGGLFVFSGDTAMSAPANDDSPLWISWDGYHRLIERLTLQVYQSGWQFDLILCLARGGVRVGDVMSRIFDVPLGILATSSYREAAGTKQGNLDIAQFITITRGAPAGRV